MLAGPGTAAPRVHGESKGAATSSAGLYFPPFLVLPGQLRDHLLHVEGEASPLALICRTLTVASCRSRMGVKRRRLRDT